MVEWDLHKNVLLRKQNFQPAINTDINKDIISDKVKDSQWDYIQFNIMKDLCI